MKKTLAAVAVLGAFAGSAMADVTVYGKIDLGLGYSNVGDTDKVEMASGNHSASRIGLKGSEKIGDMTVGFNYEFGMSADSGNLNTGSARVSQLYVKGAYGELGFGRYGVLDSGTGPYDMVGGMTHAGTGYYGDIMNQGVVMHVPATTRWNNAITYVSPTFAGVKLVAQVASGTEADTADSYKVTASGITDFKAGVKADRAGAEYSHDADMYYAVGAQYKAGDLSATLVYSTTEFKGGVEDKHVIAGVNYNFGVAKAYVAADYYKDGEGADQYGYVASVTAPAFGGEVGATVGYGDAEDTETLMAGAVYKYPLSKQTYLYGAAGWNQEKTDGVKVNTTEATFGMVHNF